MGSSLGSRADQGGGKFGYLVLTGGAGLLLLVAVAGGFILWRGEKPFHAEGGPLERAQAGLWLLSGLAALASLAWKSDARDRWLMVWLGVVALLCSAREFDLHTKLNPETLGAWGVRYRIDWWASTSAPVGARLLWMAVGAGIGFLLAVPPLRARVPWLALLRRGDAALVHLLLGFALMGGGWFADDILRPIRSVHEYIQGTEEVLEFLGACSALAGVVMFARVPLAERLRTLGLAPTLSTPPPSPPPSTT